MTSSTSSTSSKSLYLQTIHQYRRLCLSLPHLLTRGDKTLIEDTQHQLRTCLDHLKTYHATGSFPRPTAPVRAPATPSLPPVYIPPRPCLNTPDPPSSATPSLATAGEVEVKKVGEQYEVCVGDHLVLVIQVTERTKIKEIEVQQKEQMAHVMRRLDTYAQVFVGQSLGLAVVWARQLVRMYEQACDRCHRVLKCEGAGTFSELVPPFVRLRNGKFAWLHDSCSLLDSEATI